MLPARVALALQADGWYLRSEITWAKATSVDRRGSVKPESTADRPSNSSEKVYMFSKSGRYYYDRFAVAEGATPCSGRAATFARDGAVAGHVIPGQAVAEHRDDRTDTTADAIGQLRNVWLFSPIPCDWEFCKSCGTLYQGPERTAIIRHYAEPDGDTGASHQAACGSRSTSRLNLNFHLERMKLVSVTCPKCGGTDYAGKPPEHFVRHFAAYPATLPNLVIRAATSEKGVCPTCGAPWVRVVRREPNPSKGHNTGAVMTGGMAATSNPETSAGLHRNGGNAQGKPPVTTGWRQSCNCPPADQVPATVLDPFLGSGTTLLEAYRLGRDGVGIDLSPDYVAVSNARLDRLTQKGGLFP
jgi:hypothetical protein